MLKTLQQFTSDKAARQNYFDEALRKDAVKFTEYLTLSTFEMAGKPRDIHICCSLLLFL